MKNYMKIGFLGFIIIAICALISWVVVIGIIKLITILLGINFSFKFATVVWLVMILIKSLFSTNTNKN